MARITAFGGVFFHSADPAALAALEAKGVEVNGRQDMDGLGKFAWILDPDGTKIEFWQPAD